jgi:hypothetical protein
MGSFARRVPSTADLEGACEPNRHPQKATGSVHSRTLTLQIRKKKLCASVSGGVRMVQRKTEEPEVPVSFTLPASVEARGETT